MVSTSFSCPECLSPDETASLGGEEHGSVKDITFNPDSRIKRSEVRNNLHVTVQVVADRHYTVAGRQTGLRTKHLCGRAGNCREIKCMDKILKT